jgi:hypothetical protein
MKIKKQTSRDEIKKKKIIIKNNKNSNQIINTKLNTKIK